MGVPLARTRSAGASNKAPVTEDAIRRTAGSRRLPRRSVLGARRVYGVDHVQVLSQWRQSNTGAPSVHVGGIAYRFEHRVPADDLHLRAILLGGAARRGDA